MGLHSPLPPFMVLTSSSQPGHALGMFPQSTHRWHPTDVPNPPEAGSSRSASVWPGQFVSWGGLCPAGSCWRTPAGSMCWISRAYLRQAQEHRPHRQHGAGAASLQPEVGRSGRARVGCRNGHTLRLLCQEGRYVGREQNQERSSRSPLLLHRKPNPTVQHRASTLHASVATPTASRGAPEQQSNSSPRGCNHSRQHHGDLRFCVCHEMWQPQCSSGHGAQHPQLPQGLLALPVRRHRARRGQARAAR